ncbi:MAG: hypothetical protein QXW40_00010 [Thermofilum sp.]
MSLGYKLLGAALVALSAELALLVVIRRRGLREYFAREAADFLLHAGVFSLMATFSSMIAPFEVISAALRNISEVEHFFFALHKKLFQITAGAAFLYLVLTLYLGYSGAFDLDSTLAQYAYELDGLLGPLSQLATAAGILGRGASHLAALLKLSEWLRPYFDVLLASMLVPRLRRLTTPLVVFLFILTAVLPYSLALLTPQLKPLPEVTNVERGGKVVVEVYDQGQMPLADTVLIALRDSDGRVYMARVSHLTELILPEGNYTALWVAAYFTNFTVPGCCYEPVPYASCSCPLWPAKLSVKPGNSTALLVNLPVNLIYCNGGLGGIYEARREDSPLRGSMGNCSVLLAVDPPKPLVVAARAGPYRLSAANGTIIARNGTCWRVTLTNAAVLPPGTVIDFGVLRKNSEYYEWWWEKVFRALPDRVRELLAPAKISVPKFHDYGLLISFAQVNCTGAAPREIRIEIEGRCCWNLTHALPFNPFWQEHYTLAERLPALVGDAVRLGSLVWNTFLLVLAWGGGLLAALALSASILPEVVRELYAHAWKFPAGSLRLFKHLAASVFSSAAGLQLEAPDAARLARRVVKTLQQKPVPAALAALSYVRSGPGTSFASQTRRKLVDVLYSLSTYPSFKHHLEISERTTIPLAEGLFLAKQLARESYYRLRGYKVLLPYSLTVWEVEQYALGIRGYAEAVTKRYAREIEELSRKIAERIPEITSTKGWELYRITFRTAAEPRTLSIALAFLLDAHPSARRVAAELTGVAPSPWMHLDLGLELRLKVLRELAAEGELWAQHVAGLFLWSNYRFASSWQGRSQLYMYRLRRGLRCRLEALRPFY